VLGNFGDLPSEIGNVNHDLHRGRARGALRGVEPLVGIPIASNGRALLATCGLLVFFLETREINQPKVAATKGPSLWHCYSSQSLVSSGTARSQLPKKHPPITFVAAARNRLPAPHQSQRNRKSAQPHTWAKANPARG